MRHLHEAEVFECSHHAGRVRIIGIDDEIIVVGGGAAGMMAAYFAALYGKEVILLEKNDKCLLGTALYSKFLFIVRLGGIKCSSRVVARHSILCY